MAETCTNTSLLPSSGAMKPNPFDSLNYLTVPFAASVRAMELAASKSLRRCILVLRLLPLMGDVHQLEAWGSRLTVLTDCTT
jgi:hypothetical protein